MTRFSGNRGGILKVLLIIFGVIFLCVVIGGIYVAMNLKNGLRILQMSPHRNSSKSPDFRMTRGNTILAEIKQLGDDFKTGKVTTEELGRVAKTITESPLIPLAGVQMARHKYIEPSDMTEAEKAEANSRGPAICPRASMKRKSRRKLSTRLPSRSRDERQNGGWKTEGKSHAHGARSVHRELPRREPTPP